MVSVTTGPIPARPSRGIRAGAAILLVGPSGVGKTAIVVGAALGISILLSLFLARTIVQPLRSLVRAAVRVRLPRGGGDGRAQRAGGRHGAEGPDGLRRDVAKVGELVDQRQLPADEAVEQGRLAHIGASDDGDGGQSRHGAGG